MRAIASTASGLAKRAGIWRRLRVHHQGVRALLGRTRASAAAVLLAASLAVAGTPGCAGHEDRTKSALEALDRGAPRAAIAALDEELKVERPGDLPELKGDNALLLLDRGSIHQSVGEYRRSARDIGVADKAIDMLDLRRGAIDDIGKYLFSDDAGPYKAPAYEKLMINTMNLVNYLALGDLSGAKVEARRLAVVQKYVREHEEEKGLLGIGSYLSGFAFEASGDRSEALLFYDEALRYAQYRSLRDPLRVLTRGEPKSPGIDALVRGAEPLPPTSETGEGEILVVVGFGRVPQKVPKRIPVGLALTLVAGHMAPGDAARANALAAKGLVTWVNFPTLGPSRGSYAIPTFWLDGRPEMLEEALDVEHEVRKAWHKKEGTLILAAITRMIARAVAGEVAQAAGTAAAGKDGSPIGLLVGLATTATLTAVDTPDTRGWAALPARLAVARRRVPAGTHDVRLAARGQVKHVRVSVRPGGFVVVPHVVLR
jgi:uncharacterized protein